MLQQSIYICSLNPDIPLFWKALNILKHFKAFIDGPPRFYFIFFNFHQLIL